MKTPDRRQVAVYILLCLAALLGNVVSIPFFFGIDFIFGSIAVFLILGIFGVSAALPATLIASAYTYLLWNHPYAIIIFLAEVVLVGIFYRKRQFNFVFLDALFWIFIGFPLVYLFYGIVMGLPTASVLLIMLKQGINGIFNVFIAFLIISFAPLLRGSKPGHSRTISFRRLLFSLLLLALSIPALVIISVIGRNEFDWIRENVIDELNTASLEITESMEDWLSNHVHAVKYLSRLISEGDIEPSSRNQEVLKTILSLNPDFHNMYVADRDGITTAFYPPVNEKGKSTIGLNFSDREYFKRLRGGENLVISDVFQGRGGVFMPIVTISSAIRNNGQFTGFSLAALKMEHIREIITREAFNRQVRVTVIDSRNMIIASTEPERKTLDRFDINTLWDFSPAGDGVLQGFRKADHSLSQVRKWNNSVFLKVMPVPVNGSWSIIIDMPILPHIQRLNQIYSSSMLFVFILSVISVFLSHLVSSTIVNSIIRLKQSSRDLPQRIKRSEDIDWSQSVIWEVNELSESFKKTACNLATTFQSLQEKEFKQC